MAKKKGRVFSGARPTGRQHLGNYLGAIKNYVALQDTFDETIYCIVDIHALTTVETTKDLRKNTYEMALDWLAAGLRPKDSIIFIQSHVPEVVEYYGLVGYPVLMAADITLYKAIAVPVGIDQAPHIEFTREIVRSFNYRFNTKVLIEPQMVATETPKIIGIDGKNKMSKSLDNHIELAATPEETQKRVMQMVTDPQRARRSDPGNPDVCNVFSLHKIFSSKEEVAMIDTECRRAGIGCVECKKMFAKNLNNHLAPFRERRAEIAKDPNYIQDVLDDGAKRARAIARVTIAEVKEAIGLP